MRDNNPLNIKFADAYPNCTIAGVDGDQFSLDLSREKLNDRGLGDRISLERSTFEEWSPQQKFDIVYINI